MLFYIYAKGEIIIIFCYLLIWDMVMIIVTVTLFSLTQITSNKFFKFKANINLKFHFVFNIYHDK